MMSGDEMKEALDAVRQLHGTIEIHLSILSRNKEDRATRSRLKAALVDHQVAVRRITGVI